MSLTLTYTFVQIFYISASSNSTLFMITEWSQEINGLHNQLTAVRKEGICQFGNDKRLQPYFQAESLE